jgi:TadE-like protein
MNLATRKSNRAQGMIEFAIILPVLLLMLMLIFDVGRSIYAYSVIHNAAREGARFGIIHPTDPCLDPPPPMVETVVTKVRHLASGLDNTSFTVTCPTAVPGTFEVEVRYTFSAATPLLGQLLGNSTNQIELVGHSIMYIEN